MTGKDLVVTGQGGALANREIDTARLLEQWKSGRSPETLRAYESDIAHFAMWSGVQDPKLALDTLVKMHPGRANEVAHEYKTAMVDEGLAPATINRRLSALRSLVRLGKLFGFTNWTLEVQNVHSESYRDTRGPTPDEVGKLIVLAGKHADRAKAARDVALIMLMFGQGLRRAEVAKLDLVHLDVRAGRLEITGKGRREAEWITLAPPVFKAMRNWVTRRGRAPGPMFTSFRNGKPQGRLTGDGMHHLMQEWGDILEINLRPHGLRHSAITMALDATNGNVRAARKFSRHRSIETLLKYDDNREDLAGDVARKVADHVSKVVDDMETGDEEDGDKKP